MNDNIKEKIEQEAKSRYGNYQTTSLEGRVCISVFKKAAEYGYSLRNQEVEDLKEWRRQAIAIMPDMQAIGKELNVPLGQPVHDKILPGIIALKSEVQRLRELIKDMWYQNKPLGFDHMFDEATKEYWFDVFKKENNL